MSEHTAVDLTTRAPPGPRSHRPRLLFPSLPTHLAAAPKTGRSASIFGSALSGRWVVDPGAGRGHIDEIEFPAQFLGGYCDFQPNANYATTIGGENLLKFHFKLSGRNHLDFDNGESATVSGGEMAVLIHPSGINKLDCHPQDVHEHSLTFICRPDFFAETLGVEPDRLPEPLRSFALGRDPAFYLRSFAFTSSVRCDLQAMLSRPVGGPYAHLRVQARCLDLIATILEVMSGDQRDTRSTRLTPRDVQALEKVRAFLEADFAAAPTIATVARVAGINRTKLTQGFRELFHESIQDFIQRLRMEHARRLLEAGTRAGEVSAAVGYLHQSSFSQAFQSHFGVNPIDVRSRRG